ncbi:mycofactocin-coupled SDR family oxidoreductase [Mycobacterium sp. E2497]|uniref:mycofactocin-coupled SDR family oxidoreductase n=1 Tax=Mycobacterium sp. E2497 TaxID=1834135 RepID=UPI0007FFD4BC|nr:mycofactocin-coupled SDR family oxidoreductase [Mycobacterium sp. E2497]OBI14763.1 3-ketoacyl-ACP reductase [Mycobacterium sp. E2497]
MDLTGKVALVTGAARGQGRSHAIALASAGADVILVDRAADIESIPYPLGSAQDLEQTAKEVEALGRRAVVAATDVRELAALQSAVRGAVTQLGDLDIVVANAGVVGAGVRDPLDEKVFNDILSVNLIGSWHTLAATVPSIIQKKRGGAIVLIGSTQGLSGRGGDGSAAAFAYTASKHGIVGLTRSAANAYAAQGIRVNSVHPTGVATPMVLNDHMGRVIAEDPNALKLATNLLPVPFVEAQDVTEAVMWLISDAARYVTGVALPVDAGYTVM